MNKHFILQKIALLGLALTISSYAQTFSPPLPEAQRIFKLTQDTGKNTQQNKKGQQRKLDELVFLVRMPSMWNEDIEKRAKSESKHSVRGVLAICTWQTRENELKRNIQSSNIAFSHLINFADEHNLAVVTWSNFKGYEKGIDTDDMPNAQRKEYEIIFNDRLKEWERGFRRLLKHYNLPGDAIMIYGLSGGAQMAHRIVLRKPEYFSGIHMHVNSSYDTPKSGAERVLWLVTTGESEYGYDSGRRFYQSLIEMKYSAIFKAGENLGHADRDDIRNLSKAFFGYLLIFIPDASETNWKQPPVDKYYMMRHPAYVGDILNQTVYPIENAPKNIEGKNMTPLPTRKIADNWGAVID